MCGNFVFHPRNRHQIPVPVLASQVSGRQTNLLHRWLCRSCRLLFWTLVVGLQASPSCAVFGRQQYHDDHDDDECYYYSD